MPAAQKPYQLVLTPAAHKPYPLVLMPAAHKPYLLVLMPAAQTSREGWGTFGSKTNG